MGFETNVVLSKDWSSERQEQIENTILERAKFAKLARQLKLQLSKVESIKNTNTHPSPIVNLEQFDIMLNNNNLNSENLKLVSHMDNEDEMETSDAKFAISSSPIRRTFHDRKQHSNITSPRNTHITNSKKILKKNYSSKKYSKNVHVGGYNSSPLKAEIIFDREESLELLAPPSSAVNDMIHNSIPSTPRRRSSTSMAINFKNFQSPFLNENNKNDTDLLMYLSSPQRNEILSVGPPNTFDTNNQKQIAYNTYLNQTSHFDAAQLLKSPNFYISEMMHNLFSPSPNMEI